LILTILLRSASDESDEKSVYASRKETDIKAIMGKVRGMPMIGLTGFRRKSLTSLTLAST
jgi:hypothetical protein